MLVGMNVFSYLNSLLIGHIEQFSFDEYKRVNGFMCKSAIGAVVPRDFALLKIWVSPNYPDLMNVYREQIAAHNAKIFTSVYTDAGFDLFVPEDTAFGQPFQNQMVPLGIKTEMIYFNPLGGSLPIFSGFDMRPRSSISKSNLILSNHIGTIDSGYRGELIGAFRWLPVSPSIYNVDKHTRLLQICHPTLCPILVVLVNSEEELSSSERGSGGFGSTGLSGTITR